MSRNSTMPRIREVSIESNGQQKRKKRGSAGPVAYLTRNGAVPRSVGSTIGGQNYIKVQGFNSVIGGFSGTDLYVERTEAMYTFTSSATSGAFKVETLTQFPGYSGFNWLKNLSNSYGEYEVHRAEYTYVPTVPTTTGGIVAMSFYTDVRDISPTSLADVLASEQSLMAPVYAGGDGGTFLQRFGSPAGNVVSFELPSHITRFSNGVPKRFKMTSDNGMTGILAAANGSSVANQYAWGELNVASSGVTGTNTQLGTLFIRYRIRLISPLPIANQG